MDIIVTTIIISLHLKGSETNEGVFLHSSSIKLVKN